MKETWQEDVALVLAPEYGDNIREVCKRAHVWVVNTPTNRKVVESIWQSLASGQSSPATIFDWSSTEKPIETARRMLDTIEEHHPTCVKLEFIGLQQFEPLWQELELRGYSNPTPIQHGFFVSKAAP